MIMNWEKELYGKDEQPLDRLVDAYSYTSVFRTMAFIGDSLSSGEFETCEPDGKKHYHDLYDYSWGQYIARKNGLLAYNFSRGGMTAKEYIEKFAESRGFWDKEKAAQAYVIALGVNDLYNQKKPVGTLADTSVVVAAFGGVRGFCRHGVTPFYVPAVGWLVSCIIAQ